MPKDTTHVPPEVKAHAKQLREKLRDHPSVEELLTPEELADASPFYFELRQFVAQLKQARQEANLTLADVSERSGLAVETLSRLETGALVNPTWQTLSRYSAAVGRQPRLTLDRAETGPEKTQQESKDE